MADLYLSIIPFVLLMILGLLICIVFPDIILYLPRLLF
jgi:TRAP-type mannitol/chloroaromatic compound transport system permease large subunit